MNLSLVLALIYCLIVLLFSEKIVLMSLGAKPITYENNVHLYNRVQSLAEQLSIPKPHLYYLDDSAMNILALGNSVKSGKILLTKGLIEKLTAPEIEAVIAHELAHIKTLDTQVATLVTTLLYSLGLLAEVTRRKSVIFTPFSLLLSLTSPLSGLITHLVLSPKREFEADAAGVLVTRYPDGLIQALEKITHDSYSVKNATLATAHFFIVNPFHGKANRSVSSLYNTHPQMQERMKLLHSM